MMGWGAWGQRSASAPSPTLGQGRGAPHFPPQLWDGALAVPCPHPTSGRCWSCSPILPLLLWAGARVWVSFPLHLRAGATPHLCLLLWDRARAVLHPPPPRFGLGPGPLPISPHHLGPGLFPPFTFGPGLGLLPSSPHCFRPEPVSTPPLLPAPLPPLFPTISPPCWVLGALGLQEAPDSKKAT